jgi:hypothetical protein
VHGCRNAYFSVSEFGGYPMSNFFCARSLSLSYEALEIACHAIDAYRERLFLGQYEDLKVCSIIYK